ncbi:GNAT family acetyltransferase [Rhodotorula toruloides]|uniref:GNAT family acetyltransferase n=1 Tax=Rhodotorula toruloides TaxID=5286 RepID=A0A511KAF7_RHOTO|nr:GNAT family acetyltransferase [Rhodotorula toruloides]
MSSVDNPPLPPSHAQYLSLTLTPAQCDVISSYTPFRFRTVAIADAKPGHRDSLLEPYFPLPTHTNSPPLMVTPYRPTDIPSVMRTLNDPQVAYQLVGPPYPYSETDAHGWSEMRRIEAEKVFNEVLGPKAEQALKGEKVDNWVVGDWPLGNVRRADTGEWVDERKKLIDENAAKEAGDPTLAWSYGFFLDPTYHGKGLMAHLLRSLVEGYYVPYLRAKRIYGAAFATNPASLKTQERCGFVRKSSFTEDVIASRGGGKKEVITLEWQGMRA